MSKSFFVCGIVRDVEETFERNFSRLEGQFAHACMEPHWFFYENDSVDSTPKILEEYHANYDNFHYWSGTGTTRAIKWQPIATPERARQMCAYRNHYLRWLEYHNYDYDYTLIVDMDLPLLTLEGMGEAMLYDADMVGCNGQAEGGRYYDTWALGGYPPKHHRAIGEQEDRIPVTSCFGGMGLYKTSSLRSSWYDEHVTVAPDADHGTLHTSMIEKGHSEMYICPSWAVKYSSGA
jgi:hypothetical protein